MQLNSFTLASAFAAAACALLVSRLLTGRPRFGPTPYIMLLVLSCAPWFAHFTATRTHCAGWGCAALDVVPRQGIALYSIVSPVAVGALLVAALAAARARPAIAACLPLAVAGVEIAATRLLSWNASADYFYANHAADRWLLASSLAAAACLVTYSSLRRPARAAAGR